MVQCIRSLSDEAVKILVNLDKEIEETIREKIKKLATSPESFGKHLKGIDLRSLRVGKYRVLFEIDREKEEILVTTIGHRKHVYRRLKKK